MFFIANSCGSISNIIIHAILFSVIPFFFRSPFMTVFIMNAKFIVSSIGWYSTLPLSWYIIKMVTTIILIIRYAHTCILIENQGTDLFLFIIMLS